MSSSFVRALYASVGVSLLTKVATFALNLLLARHVSRDDYGWAFLSLQLYTTLQLFPMKEGFRRAAARCASPRTQAQLIVIGIFVSTVAGVVVGYGMFWPADARPPRIGGGGGLSPKEEDASRRVSFIRAALVLMYVGGIVEAAVTEPLLLLGALRDRYEWKPVAEGGGMMVRSVSLAGLVLLLRLNFILAFAVAHCLGTTVTAGMLISRAREFFRKSGDATTSANYERHLLTMLTSVSTVTKPVESLRIVGIADRDMAWNFLLLAGQKLLLSEGEKMLLKIFFSESTWGVFALVSNFGSLILRLLFAPVEDVAFSFFSALSAGREHAQKGTADRSEEDTLNNRKGADNLNLENSNAEQKIAWRTNNTTKEKSTTASASTSSQQRQHLQKTVLQSLLAVQGSVGLLGLLYGPANAVFALQLLYGRKWSADAETVTSLRLYCGFLFLAALNGILEAYVHAVADPQWIRKNLWFQMGCFVGMSGFVCAMHMSGMWTAAGLLIVANAGVMAARVARCVHFCVERGVSIVHPTVLPLWTAFLGAAALSNFLIVQYGRIAKLEADMAGGGVVAQLKPFLVHVPAVALPLAVGLGATRGHLVNLGRSFQDIRKSV